MTRYPGDLECPICKIPVGADFEDVSGSNEGTEPFYCNSCGRAMTITTDFYFSIELANPEEEE